MNSGSTSIERQSETQAPHWMQAIVCVTSIIDSIGTTYSRSGGSPSGSSHGVTRWIFFQWTASMSTIRSLITGMLPIGSTVMTGRCPRRRVPARWPSAASSRCVWQASAGLPLIRTPQEPQIAARHEQRMPIEPSWRSLAWRIPSRTERFPSRSIVNSSQYAAVARLGRVAAELQGVFGHQYFRSCGLPLGHRDRRVADLRRVAAVDGQVDVLEPLVVVALGEVEPELRAARLLALDRAGRRCTPRSRACSRARSRRARPG